MPLCPVCEHLQGPGESCEVCGKPLSAPGSSAGPVAPLEGLEPTAVEAPLALDPDPLPELEPTRVVAPLVNLAVGAADWVEATRVDAIGDVPTEPVAGLELLTRGGAATPRAPAVCRYCRTPAMAGDAFCSRCGMRLAVQAEEGARAGEAPPPRRCRSCGASGAGERCDACGARLTEGR